MKYVKSSRLMVNALRLAGTSSFILVILSLMTFFDNAFAQVGPTVDPAQMDECTRLGIDLSQCNETNIEAKKRLLANPVNVPSPSQPQPQIPFDWTAGGLVIVAVVAIVGVVIVAIVIKRPIVTK